MSIHTSGFSGRDDGRYAGSIRTSSVGCGLEQEVPYGSDRIRLVGHEHPVDGDPVGHGRVGGPV